MSHDLEHGASVPTGARYALWIVLGFLAATVGGGFAMKSLDLGWTGAAIYVVFLLAITVTLMRWVQRTGMQAGCSSAAITRYNRRMLWGTIGYMIGLFAAVWLFNSGHVGRPWLWGVALLPTVPVLAMVWAMGRLLVEEADEYIRFRLVKQALFATGGLLAVSTIWGFLEQFDLVVHVPVWASVPVFAVMLGVGQCFRWVRS